MDLRCIGPRYDRSFEHFLLHSDLQICHLYIYIYLRSCHVFAFSTLALLAAFSSQCCKLSASVRVPKLCDVGKLGRMELPSASAAQSTLHSVLMLQLQQLLRRSRQPTQELDAGYPESPK